MPLRTDGLSFDELGTDPTTPEPGALWYNTTDAKLKYFDGTDIIILPSQYKFDPGRTIQVAKSGTDYSTIGSGIAAAVALSPDASNPVAVLVYPGTYEEWGLTLPEFISLIGVGGAVSTKLTTSTINETFLTLSGSQLVSGFSFEGATGLAGTAVKLPLASTEARVFGCIVKNCQRGFLSEGAGATLYCNMCSADSRLGNPVDSAFYCRSGGEMHILGGQVTGDATTVVGYGYRCEGGSLLRLKGSYVTYADYGIYANDDGVIEGTAGECDYCDVGIAMVSTTSNTEISLSGFELKNNTSWDVDLGSATDGTFNLSGIADEEKINIPDAFSDFAVSVLNRDDLHRGQEVLGMLSVGSVSRPSEAFFGQGSPYFKGVAVLSNNSLEAGTWVDNTAAARSKSGSTFPIIQSVGVDNCAYFGADEPFAGIGYSITSPMIAGTGLIIAEYWNGTAWTQFRTMSYEPMFPYNQYSIDAFVRFTPHEHINFEAIFTDMQTRTLYGYTKYWARLRVVSAVTSVPIAEYARALASSLYIDTYGTPIRTGRARQVKTIAWHRNLMDPGTAAAPSAANIQLSTNISLAATFTTFTNNAVDSKGGVIVVPTGLDTSDPLKLNLSWYSDVNTGNVNWRIFHMHVKDGDVIDGSLADTRLDYIVPVPATAKALVSTEIEIPVYDVLPGYKKVILVYRDATNGNADDTAPGDAVILDASLQGTFWR